MRNIKTEYVSCPSCGRTLFDLQEVTEQIRQRTGHLPGAFSSRNTHRLMLTATTHTRCCATCDALWLGHDEGVAVACAFLVLAALAMRLKTRQLLSATDLDFAIAGVSIAVMGCIVNGAPPCPTSTCLAVHSCESPVSFLHHLLRGQFFLA